MKQELRNYKLDVEAARNNIDVSDVTSIDIIRRVSQLEKVVFGKKDDTCKEEEEESTEEEKSSD